MLRRLTVLVVLGGVLLPTVTARAQDAAATGLARKHYELGEQLYKTSNYPAALAEFQKAYELARKPELLFNIARCHEVMAQLEKAVETYEQYLAEKPDAENADLVRTRLANLRQQLAARRAQEANAAKEQEQKAQAEQEANKPPPPPPATAEPPSRWKRTAGWITVGIGAACLGTGIAFGVLAKGKADDYESGASGSATYGELQAIDQDGRRFNKIAIATLVVGGVALAAGAGLVVWDLLGAGKERRSAALVLPYAAESGGGVVATFGF